MLEVLHPDGFARRSLVLGSACPPGLLHGGAESAVAPGSADLVVVAPSREERRSPDWLSTAFATMTVSLAPEGVGYAIVPRLRRRSIGRLVVASGLENRGAFVHLPALGRTRHLVPLERGPLSHLAAALLPPTRWRSKTVALADRLPRPLLVELAGGVGVVLGRPGARELFDWLIPDGERGSVAVSRSWHGVHDGLVLRRFAPGSSSVVAVAKLKLDPEGSAVTTGEGTRLEETARQAADAGVETPQLVSLAKIGARSVLVQTAVPGRVAAPALQSTPQLLAPTVDRLAAWLSGWHEVSRTSRPLADVELEHALLRPASAVAPELTHGREYARWLEELCVELEGMQLPCVGAHNDLTMWNVLLQEDGRLGVVDWEGASDAGLPLADFYYAAVDAVDAAAGYRDRLSAFRSCFVAGGRHADQVARLEARLRAAVGLPSELATFCFHACWLAHATDERRPAGSPDRLPFLHIVDWLARNREALAVAHS